MNRKAVKHTLLLVVVLLLAITPFAVVLAQDEAPSDLVQAQAPGIYPEGIEYDEAGERFLIGSLSQGTIFSVADDGTATAFVEDKDIVSSVGLHIDEVNNRLLVAVGDSSVFSDPDATGIAALGMYDLETGERQHWVDLAGLVTDGRHFANDLTSDAAGNVYVTDSFSPVIYKVDPEGNASIFLEAEEFAADPESGSPGLNGIEYHPDGYLLAAVSGTASIYKIPLDTPEELTQVELQPAVSGDGMVLDANGNLVVVGSVMGEDGNPTQSVVSLISEDDWASASIAGRLDLDRQASTAAIRGENVYIIFPGFEVMFSGGEPPETFDIVRVEFEDAVG